MRIVNIEKLIITLVKIKIIQMIEIQKKNQMNHLLIYQENISKQKIKITKLKI